MPQKEVGSEVEKLDSNQIIPHGMQTPQVATAAPLRVTLKRDTAYIGLDSQISYLPLHQFYPLGHQYDVL